MPDTPLEAQIIEPSQLESRNEPKKITMSKKLNAYDPAIHGGELWPDEPVGAEFGVRQARQVTTNNFQLN
jgi:hypothetical protein